LVLVSRIAVFRLPLKEPPATPPLISACNVTPSEVCSPVSSDVMRITA